MEKMDQVLPQKRKTSKTFLIGALLLIILTLLSAVIALSVLYSNANNNNNKSKVCLTKACISSANNILRNIDTTADPCEDFNRFSCGTFIDTKRIPDDQSSDDTFSVLRINLASSVADALEKPIKADELNATQNAKRFYLSCLNETHIETYGKDLFANTLINGLGGWPLIGQSYSSTRDHLEQMLAFHKIGVRPFFYVGVDVNPKTPDYLSLEAGQAGWFFDRKYYSDDKVMAAYKTFITKVVTEMSPSGAAVPTAKIEAMIQLEKDFGQYLYNISQKRAQTYKNTTLAQLYKDIPDFDWVEFIKNGIFKEYPNLQINDNEQILVNEWDYLTNATKVYKKALTDNRETLVNLMVWSFVKERTGYLPKIFRDARLDFDKAYTGTNAIAARSRTCANAALDRMPYAVGRLYVKDNFDENSKKAVEEMVQNIRDEFKSILNNVQWMDESSKKSAREKADSIDVKMAYPDFTYNDTYLNTLYNKFDFQDNEYLANSVKVSKANFVETFSKLKEKNDRKDWISGPAVVNAFYSPPANQICFPAGILQAPFYDSKSPNYLNYGGIGSVIGHEITHGFDDQGRLYDKDGVYFPDGTVGLWTNYTIQSYKDRAQCIVDQYSNYVAKQVGMNLNGYQTQGENIADNGGIKEAFGAYQKWVAKNGPENLLPGLEQYTQTQLFFINYGQVWCSKFRDQTLSQRILTGVHSPGEFRIIGPTSNFPEFQKAFNCKANQANNPTKKCSVW